jgi:Protein of unknown function (DUF3300)
MIFSGTISGQRAAWKLSAIIQLSCFLLLGSLRAQAPPPPLAPPLLAAESAPSKLPPEALNQLLAPIALYPDALVALILPASTVPSDVVLAARYISSNGDPEQAANQPWDDSVKSLARYPDVVKWMDQNLEWTTQVGEAFLDQPTDVMNTIQQLRAQAIAAGNLVDTTQQRIVKEESCVRIVPAEPEVIYVPRYDPEAVYVRPYEPYLGPALTFGVGFAVGSWLNYDCDWPRRRVCVGHWNPEWKHKWKPNRSGDYDVSNTFNVVNINSDTARVWQPSAKGQRQEVKRQRAYQEFDAQNTTPSYSKANKHSQSARIKTSKGGPQNSGASYSKPKKSQSTGASGKGSGGGGHKSGKKGGGNKGDKGKK